MDFVVWTPADYRDFLGYAFVDLIGILDVTGAVSSLHAVLMLLRRE